MKRILILAFTACSSLLAWAQQDTIFLNSQREFVQEKSEAKECALIRKADKGIKQVDFYTLDGRLTTSSQYKKFGKTPDSQVLHGATHYRFSDSEQDSLSVFYKNNRRNGSATFYYPSGKVMVQCQYKNDALNGLLQQFYEDGKLKRREIYQDNRSIEGKLLAQDSTELAFSPFYESATPAVDEKTLIQAICRGLQLPTEVMKDMAEKRQYRLTLNVGILVDEKGKAIDFIVLSTQHPKLNKSCFSGVIEILNQYTFVPGKINDRETTTVAVLQEPIVVTISNVAPMDTPNAPNTFRSRPNKRY